MRIFPLAVSAGLLLSAAGCAHTTGIHRLTLQSETPMPIGDRGTVCWLFYSFAEGRLKRPIDPGQNVDLMYYYDDNDCAGGALMGQDYRPGDLFPIGHKSWRELTHAEPPTEGVRPVAAIAPLTKDKEGLAFWVRTRGGEYVLARIRKVAPATYSELVTGRTATLDLEWKGGHPYGCPCKSADELATAP